MKNITKETYLENVKTANAWSYAYYTMDAPQATDAEYDDLMKEIKAFEKETGFIDSHSPTQRIGDVTLEGFSKIKHEVKMYSLEDIFNYNELVSWFDKIKKDAPDAVFYAEPKYDGLSLNITYEDGVLVSAGTRGTGEEGEDVTANVYHIKGIPLSIPSKERIEIRGEVVIFKENFEEINQNRIAGGKEPYANERNAAAGALRSFESRWVKNAQLRFVPYGIGRADGIECETQSGISKFIEDLGFTNWGSIWDDRRVFSKVELLEEFYRRVVSDRNGFRMLLDGIVIKVDDIHMQEDLGFTSKTPKWAVAYKFPAQEKTAKIEDIILQVGKTGAITPVAVISPTEIDGSVIRRVTLHNFEEIQRRDIRIGDSVGVIKSGDVIPKIISVFKERRDGSEMPTVAPTECPVCGSRTEKAKLFNSDKEGSILKCSSSKCPAVLVGKLQAAVSKKALDIDALGESTVELLIQKGLVTELKDFFSLTPDALLQLDGFQKRKAEKTVEAIQGIVGKVELHRFIKMFDIELIGERASIKIAKALGLGAISRELTLAEVTSIEDIGEAMGANYYNFVKENEDMIYEMYGIIRPVFVEETIQAVASIVGKKFVITGTLSQSRGVFQKMIEEAGGKVSSGVSKTTDYLLAGAEAGSKLDKAVELGVTVLDEDGFNKLMGL